MSASEGSDDAVCVDTLALAALWNEVVREPGTKIVCVVGDPWNIDSRAVDHVRIVVDALLRCDKAPQHQARLARTLSVVREEDDNAYAVIFCRCAPRTELTAKVYRLFDDDDVGASVDEQAMLEPVKNRSFRQMIAQATQPMNTMMHLDNDDDEDDEEDDQNEEDEEDEENENENKNEKDDD
jgi:hypothetical protein